MILTAKGRRTKKPVDYVMVVLLATSDWPPLVYHRRDLVGRTVRQAWDSMRHEFSCLESPLKLNGTRVPVKSSQVLRKGDKLTAYG